MFPERITVLIRDRTVIIDDDAVRSTKIACGLNLVDHIAELPVLNAEPIADEFRRISSLVTNGVDRHFGMTTAGRGVSHLVSVERPDRPAPPNRLR